MPLTCASDVPDAITKKSVASDNPRRSSTTTCAAFRSDSPSRMGRSTSSAAAGFPRERPRPLLIALAARVCSVLHLIKHAPGSDARMGGQNGRDGTDQSFLRRVPADQFLTKRFGELVDAGVHHAEPESAGFGDRKSTRLNSS